MAKKVDKLYSIAILLIIDPQYLDQSKYTDPRIDQKKVISANKTNDLLNKLMNSDVGSYNRNGIRHKTTKDNDKNKISG